MASSSVGAGRPSTACFQCKNQKVRCSGDVPRCQRCTRTNNACRYPSSIHPIQRHRARGHSSQDRESATTKWALDFQRQMPTAQNISRHLQVPGEYLGIPESIVNELVELFFSHVYNAHLLLHKGRFLDARASGNVRPHIILSLCAWGAVFHRDEKDQALLLDRGFAREWADRAGKLALNEVEMVHEDNIVTFASLSLFWYTQGSWRRSYIHKGNAMQTAHILDLAGEEIAKDRSLTAEISRRRFWACYLVNCHSTESMFVISTPQKIAQLPLPWRGDEFERGFSQSAPVTFGSGSSNAGIYSEMIRGMTHWSSVNALIKNADSKTPEMRITAIHQLDAKVNKWWSELPEDLRLTPTNLHNSQRTDLAKVLLINIVYYQCLCALHASIVPLFSWGADESTTILSQQFSAQIAYDNACAISRLFEMVLNQFPEVEYFPSFIGFAAYCSFAVQIPFKWCLNGSVRERTETNVAINLRVIRGMARYWKFVALLEKYAQYLTQMHGRNNLSLDDEPRGLSSGKLAGFRIRASRARASILSMNGILWNEDGGYSAEGDEVTELGPDETSMDAGPQAVEVTPRGQAPLGRAATSKAQHHVPSPAQPDMATAVEPIDFSTSPSIYDGTSAILPGEMDYYNHGSSLDFFQPMLGTSDLFQWMPEDFHFNTGPSMTTTYNIQADSTTSNPYVGRDFAALSDSMPS